MPMDTLARRVAVDLTGRTRWAEDKGPVGFAGRDHIDLFCDLLFKPKEMFREELIPVENKPLKKEIGLDPDRKFFAPSELMLNTKLQEIGSEFQLKKQRNTKYRGTQQERAASDTQKRMSGLVFFVTGQGIAMSPMDESETLEPVGIEVASHGTESVQEALVKLQEAYLNDGDLVVATQDLTDTLSALGTPVGIEQSKISYELFYNSHNPWKKAAIATLLAMVLVCGRWLTRSKILTVFIGVAILWAMAEQGLGLWLRVSILGRAPVSNTYEALLWMGIVAILFGLIGQAVSPKSWYLVGGLGASVLAIFFAMLVPIEDQTNALPAVLRSNYWLIIHVLTIVGSYGALLLAAVLAHIYLVRDVLLRRQSARNNRVIVQVYRVMQVGVIMLTAGTILGGVWAADSWGRFWGWDPKETWSLISIITYFTMLHARHVGWIRDFGLAVAAVVGFLAIVWTFYGVNYVMASGLHSYGFGSGGELWVLLWAIAEAIFIGICFLRRPQKPNKDRRSNSKYQVKVADVING
ncbi:MAG: cytochrome c biogenesis protein CcsA [Phycisphaerales bacterium]|nr:cytochrome c biogenesis protein CcsA [Phycisphaerales bacterium]